MIGKHKIETMCRAGGLLPVARDNIDGAELFVADGFSSPPHQKHRRFLDADEFPFGCFVTLWWLSKGDEKLDTGQPLFFDAFHDGGHTALGKQLARIAAAKKTAREFLMRRKIARLRAH